MRFIVFCRSLGLALCANAVTVCFASHSIPLAIVTTLACSLLLQVVYFASVLFLIWRSGSAREARQSADVLDRGHQLRYQSPDDDEGRNEASDVSLRNQMLGISMLLP
ncbi:MAG: exopolysaccharide repressor protein [Mesorhizobium sp.]|uniref:exopolysaccharide production repressor protein n=1 Tax=Mesorhizobium sp. TaxID=1871066 RepID=UPI000FE6CB62|nr:exopolysaccharide production repressor protein [Mesorhizobium sp.]RWA97938.1 MAG: exopolysaccharide repressor protein [Mesorhizobium sp.]RWK59799.1 MAG: exopolysaccharide repressor protein [Mesorhizobium sp.]RWM44459.1 MAG: exopolysaccharide repressor protein [Mesorhizobium sp.]RWM49117.1 MAG: exopolysaccharide repressor protein [Mesorhizobium sp.]RWO23205.1 MAG: exopolysaccharide repressor protein [Mesorhizobium sp.]